MIAPLIIGSAVALWLGLKTAAAVAAQRDVQRDTEEAEAHWLKIEREVEQETGLEVAKGLQGKRVRIVNVIRPENAYRVGMEGVADGGYQLDPEHGALVGVSLEGQPRLWYRFDHVRPIQASKRDATAAFVEAKAEYAAWAAERKARPPEDPIVNELKVLPELGTGTIATEVYDLRKRSAVANALAAVVSRLVVAHPHVWRKAGPRRWECGRGDIHFDARTGVLTNGTFVYYLPDEVSESLQEMFERTPFRQKVEGCEHSWRMIHRGDFVCVKCGAEDGPPTLNPGT